MRESFFFTGGTLRYNAPSYVERRADRELFDALQAGEYCYVLTSRQMGKSSLMVRTAGRLHAAGSLAVILDLTSLGQTLAPEQWYWGLLHQLGLQLNLEETLDEYWRASAWIGPLHRFVEALRQVVLPTLGAGQRLVIFIDEIDAVRSLSFPTDEFFAAIRACYNRRAEDAAFAALSFCLSGEASPSDLIEDTRTTPFNIGRRIELTDFTAAEAHPLAGGLPGSPAQQERQLARVLYWTGGHPYLTQRLCRALREKSGEERVKSGPQPEGAAPIPSLIPHSSPLTPRAVDGLSRELFLSAQAREKDDNLLFVRDRLLRNGSDPAALLDLYGKIRAGQWVVPDDSNPLLDKLRLAGVVRLESGTGDPRPGLLAGGTPAAGRRLVPRNRIYAAVFSPEWVQARLPDAEVERQKAAYRRGIRRTAGGAGLLLAMMTGLTGWAVNSGMRAERSAGEARREAAAKAAALRRAEENAEAARRSAAEAETAREEAQTARRKAEQSAAAEATARLAAHSAQRRAEGSATEERRARARAEQSTALARHSVAAERQAREHGAELLYIANMNVIQRDWDAAQPNIKRMLKLLEETQTSTYRGFEWSYWNHLCHRERLSLNGAQAPVKFSPDGHFVLTGSSDCSAKLWDADTGQEIRTLKGHALAIFGVAFAPDGKRVLTGSEDKTAKLWDAASGREFLTLRGHTDFVTAVAFTPDGLRVLTGSNDRAAKLWDARTGLELLTLLGHTGALTSVSFSPDGTRIVTGSMDGTARLWDAHTGRELLVLRGHNGGVQSAAFSPDGQKLLTGGVDDTAKLWDAATGRELFSLRGHNGDVYAAEFSPDGDRVLTGSLDTTAKLWDAGTGIEILTLKGHTSGVRGVAFSPDGRRWLTAGQDQPFTGGAPVARLVDGRLRLTGTADGTAKLWDAEAARASITLQGNIGWVRAVAASPDGRRLLTGGDRTAKLWDAATGRELLTLEGHTAVVFAVTFAPDGRRVLTGSRDGTAKLWDAATGREVLTLKGHTGDVNAVAFAPDGKHVLTGSRDGTAKLWDAATGRELLTLKGHKDRVMAVAFAPDGKHVLTGSFDTTAKLWDAATGRELRTFQGHRDKVWAVAYAPDGRRVLTGSFDATAKLWDAVTGRVIHTLQGHAGNVNGVAFSPDGRRMLTGGNDNTAQLWDTTTGREILTLRGHTDLVRSVGFSPDGRRVLTGSQDGTARIWEGGELSASAPGARDADARSALGLSHVSTRHRDGSWKATRPR